MSEHPLPTRLRAILARQPESDASDQQVDQYIDDLEGVIRSIEQIQITVSRDRLRRKE